VPDGQALSKAREIALDIAHNCAPLAVRAGKRMAYEALSGDLAAALARCGEMTDQMHLREDFKEGVRSFAEARPPRFTGR
jgi:enoyl-CoA hydratase/carnithine racemase